jgi:spore germination protein KB
MKGRIRMIKEGKIGLHEAIAISTLSIVTKVFYTNPSAVVKSTGTAGWYATLISVLASALIFLIIYALLKRFPGKDLNDIFDIVFGKVVGKAFSFLFIGYFIFYAGSNLREFVEMIKAYNLPYTQPSVIIFTFLLPIALISYLGFEVLSRISYIGFWIVLGGIFIILVLAVPIYQINSIYPLGGYGIKKSISIGITRLSAYDELIILCFLVSSLQEIKNVKIAGLTSLAISGTAISLVILCSILAFDFTMARENLSNLFELSRSIYLSRFFQRLESIFLFVWVIASVILVTIIFYLALSIFCKTFRINNQRPLILPFIFITFTIALLPENLPQTINVGTNFQRQSSALIVYLIPVITLIVSFIFKKKGAENNFEKN